MKTDGVVMVDGGIRREGVARAIAILKADLERTMILLGVASVAELDPSLVDVPEHWRGDRFPANRSMPS